MRTAVVGIMANTLMAKVMNAAALIGVAVFGQMGVASQAFAGQLISTKDCNFVVHVPGFAGGTDLHLKMARGTVFTEDNNHKFCGPVAQATPFGESNGIQCFVVTVTDGKLVSGAYGNKVTSSECVLTDAAAMSVPFVVEDFAAWAGSGAGNLHGQAFLKTVGGDVKTCAGERVLLLPGVPYVDELLEKGRHGISVSPDPRLASYERSTVCDAQGNFSFTQLPAQRWHVLTRVTWAVPHINPSSIHQSPLASLLFGVPPQTDQQGGDLEQAVVVSTGDNQAFLTYRDEW